MSTILPITSVQFTSLMKDLNSYICSGSTRTYDSVADVWDSLYFRYDGDSSMGINFHLTHPYSSLSDKVNYDVIEIRFSSMYPFNQEWGFRITDSNQVKELTDTVTPKYLKHIEDNGGFPQINLVMG